MIETHTKPQFQPLSIPSKKVRVNILSGAAVMERPDFIIEKKTRQYSLDYYKFFFLMDEFQRSPKTEDEFKCSMCDVYLRHALESGESIYLAHSALLTYHSLRLREDFRNS